MSKLLTIVMEIPIKVELGDLSKFKMNRSIKLNSGQWKLGVNSIIGRSFTDGQRNIKVVIGKAKPEQIRQFYKGFKGRKILDNILKKFLPVTMQVDYEFHTLDNLASFKLSSKDHKCYLGINTRL